MEKPNRRSKLRLTLGKIFYTYKRYFFWIFSRLKFARIDTKELRNEHFSHKTPLLRKLKNVDMYLQYNKIVNLRIAVKKLNKVTIHPGEVFSYWKLIGKPTKRKGYLEGMVLQSGKYTAGIGGGLCQLSNLIYWMTIHTPLTIIERHRHSYDVFPDSDRTQPFGSGATCYYNYIDLMIRNDTDISFQLFLNLDDENLCGAWKCEREPDYTYEIYEKEHIIKQELWGNYSRHNIIFRKKYNCEGEILADEFVVENHALMMYQPLIAENS